MNAELIVFKVKGSCYILHSNCRQIIVSVTNSHALFWKPDYCNDDDHVSFLKVHSICSSINNLD
jgi:hypothetical protein